MRQGLKYPAVAAVCGLLLAGVAGGQARMDASPAAASQPRLAVFEGFYRPT